MRITYSLSGNSITYFSELDNGAVFRYEHEGYFMKVSGHVGPSEYNAVDLEDFSLLSFEYDDRVTPVNATLNIEGEEP